MCINVKKKHIKVVFYTNLKVTFIMKKVTVDGSREIVFKRFHHICTIKWQSFSHVCSSEMWIWINFDVILLVEVLTNVRTHIEMCFSFDELVMHPFSTW